MSEERECPGCGDDLYFDEVACGACWVEAERSQWRLGLLLAAITEERLGIDPDVKRER